MHAVQFLGQFHVTAACTISKCGIKYDIFHNGRTVIAFVSFISILLLYCIAAIWHNQ